MTKQTEALKMPDLPRPYWNINGSFTKKQMIEYAKQACKEALENLEKDPPISRKALAETQEPVYTNGDRTMSMKDRNFTSEGNGYIQDNNFDFDAGLRIGGDFVNDEQDQYAQMICNALNTTPPSREHKASLWQGLSDAELDLIVLISGHSYKTLAEKIEAKLREKNNA